jgi:NhaP-type Na+/H+ and K+/H+ antiporter
VQRSELGRFAHEKKMPPWLVALLQDEGQVVNNGESTSARRGDKQCLIRTIDVLPVLSQLLEQSPSTQYAYLCQPSVQHISKLKQEGEPLPSMAVYILAE